MPLRTFRIPRLLLALAALAGSVAAWPASAKLGLCERHTVDGASVVVCTVKPADAQLRLFWRDASGAPFRRFASVAKTVQGEGRMLAFAINGGMYDTDFSPIGLYVEAGRELRPVNTRSLGGSPAQVPNFYKRPNGVFFVDEAGAGVLTTEAFLARKRPVRFATQSGPMLVIDNALHPAFIEGSTDRTRRSGVGVCQDGQVRFVMSESLINFHDFARVFRDHLQCRNALFLDGGRGAGLYSPDLGRNDFSWHGGYGPILGMVAPVQP